MEPPGHLFLAAPSVHCSVFSFPKAAALTRTSALPRGYSAGGEPGPVRISYRI